MTEQDEESQPLTKEDVLAVIMNDFVTTEQAQAMIENENVEKCILPIDAFSFLVVALPRKDKWLDPYVKGGRVSSFENTYCYGSRSFWCGFLVFVVETLTLTFLAIDQIDLEDEKNPLGVPPNVDGIIRSCQFLAFIIAVTSQDNVIESVNSFCQGLPTDALLTKQAHESIEIRISRWWWVSVTLLRLVMGLFSLAVTFMLVMRAESVRDLLLNFTAVEFVTSLDNIAFNLASWNFFGIDAKEDADMISNAKFRRKDGREGAASGLASPPASHKLSDATASPSRRPMVKAATGVVGRTASSSPSSDSAGTQEQGDEAAGKAKETKETERDEEMNKRKNKEKNEEEDEDKDKNEKISKNAAPMGWKSCCKHFAARVSQHHRHITLLLVFLMMFAPWLIIAWRQANGRYLCTRIHVQFGDEFSASLGAFSGLYKRRDGISGRGGVEYEEESKSFSSSSDARFPPASFIYCRDEKSWVFVHRKEPQQAFNPCSDWTARSPKTLSFDLTSTASDEWLVRDDSKGSLEVPLTQFRLSCYDCSSKGIDGFCGDGKEVETARGRCVENKCECHDGWFGLRCEFPEPCSTLAVDERFGEFVGKQAWASEFTVLEKNNQGGDIVQVYGRPVFWNNETGDVIFFAGRRWGLTSSDNSYLLDYTGKTGTDLSAYFETEFHAHWSNFTLAFLSEAVDVDTPADAVTPVGLDWFLAEEVNIEEDSTSVSDMQSPDQNSLIDSTLLCAMCDNETNPCLYQGRCTDTGVCDCEKSGSAGRLCQITPDGNGRCDSTFNRANFRYDGGDCCEATCISSEQFRCGNGKGIYSCIDPEHNTCSMDQDMCLKSNGIDITGKTTSANSGSVVALSSSGSSSIAVGEPGSDTVRIFVKDGSLWVQKGDDLIGPENSRFGSSVALSGDGDLVAIGGPSGDSGGVLRIYKWNQLRGWQLEAGMDGALMGSDIFKFGAALGMSTDGTTLAVVASRQDGSFQVRLWENQSDTNQTIQPVVGNNNNPFRESLSLSGDGNTIATQGKNTSSVQVYRRTVGSTFATLGPELVGCHALISGDGQVVVLSPNRIELLSVHAYRLNETKHNASVSWEQFGGTIEGGIPLAISWGGDVVAVRMNETVQLYRLGGNGEMWELIGDVPADKDASAALASQQTGIAGTILAVGVPTLNEFRGSTAAYRFILSVETSAPSMQPSISPSASAQPTLLPSIMPSVSLLPTVGPSSAPTVSLIPSISSSPSTESAFPTASAAPSSLPTRVPSASPTEFPTLEPTLSPTPEPTTLSPTTLSPTAALKCNGSHKVTIRILTDDNPSEISYELTNLNLGRAIMVEGPFFQKRTEFVNEFCLQGLGDQCMRFSIFDDVGDGIQSPGFFKLLVDDDEILMGNSFGSSLTNKFGLLDDNRCNCEERCGAYGGTCCGRRVDCEFESFTSPDGLGWETCRSVQGS